MSVSTWQIASEQLREENVLNRSTFDTNNTMFRSLFSATLSVEHDTQPSIILATFPKNLRHSSSSTCTPSWSKGFTFSAWLYPRISDLQQDLNNYSHSLRLWVNIHSTHYECVWCNYSLSSACSSMFSKLTVFTDVLLKPLKCKQASPAGILNKRLCWGTSKII